MTSKVLNFVLAIALVILAVLFVMSKNECQPSKDGVTAMENDALEVIYNRSSIRNYTEQEVTPEQVETLLKAAMSAPTARDCRPWDFVVINDKDLMKTFADSMPHSKMLKSAPIAIVTCGNLTKAMKGAGEGFWIQDLSAATENLLLAATAQGLGAVWTGVYPIPERVALVSKLLNLPDSIVPLALIPVGHPAGDIIVKDKWDTQNIHYNNKW